MAYPRDRTKNGVLVDTDWCDREVVIRRKGNCHNVLLTVRGGPKERMFAACLSADVATRTLTQIVCGRESHVKKVRKVIFARTGRR